jgi:hypothetical protein
VTTARATSSIQAPIILLIGLGLGLLLPRPWAEVPEAEAKNAGGTYRCVGSAVVVHNLDSKPIEPTVKFCGFSGVLLSSTFPGIISVLGTNGAGAQSAYASDVSVDGAARVLGVTSTSTLEGATECIKLGK